MLGTLPDHRNCNSAQNNSHCTSRFPAKITILFLKFKQDILQSCETQRICCPCKIDKQTRKDRGTQPLEVGILSWMWLKNQKKHQLLCWFDRIEQTWQRKIQLYFVSPLFEQPDPPFTSNVPARHSPPSLPPGTDSVTCFWRFSASPYDWNLLCCLTDLWTSWGLQAL